MSEELVVIAKITRLRGLRGEVVAEILTDFPERFEQTKEVTGLLADGAKIELELEKFWFQKDRVVLKFKDFDTPEKAEVLKDAEICIGEADAVELSEDEFFDWELQGCLIETMEGERIGTVKEILRTGGTEILVVESDEKEHLIPFAEAICTEVDIEGKLIKVDLPEGLLDF